MRISDWMSDVCSSDLLRAALPGSTGAAARGSAAPSGPTRLLPGLCHHPRAAGDRACLRWADHGPAAGPRRERLCHLFTPEPRRLGDSRAGLAARRLLVAARAALAGTRLAVRQTVV